MEAIGAATAQVRGGEAGLGRSALLDLGLKFNSKIANELMTERKGAAVNLCYQLKLGLENAKAGGAKPTMRRGKQEPVLLGSTLKPQRSLLASHARMESEHFEALVKQQVQDPKQLAQALSLAKYTEHMIAQQKQDEELDALRPHNCSHLLSRAHEVHCEPLVQRCLDLLIRHLAAGSRDGVRGIPG